jgi:hypothetical protein
MKRAAQLGMVAQIAGLCFAVVATRASADEVAVTDADRTYRNFTQETATVRQGEIRLEVRGLMEQDDGPHTRLDLLGFPVKNVPALSGGVSKLSGGIIDVVGSYGFAKNTEIGFIIPSFIQSATPASGGNAVNDSDIGDVAMYGKFQRAVAAHCNVGAGLQITLPNGPKNKGFGTGETGVTPVLSTRYQQGRIGVGANVGWSIYTGGVPDVLNYGAEVILQGSSTFALRTEIAGRVFDMNGIRYDDLQVLPGIDYWLSDTIVIRPTGMAQGTGTALDWGVGAGMAVSF